MTASGTRSQNDVSVTSSIAATATNPNVTCLAVTAITTSPTAHDGSTFAAKLNCVGEDVPVWDRGDGDHPGTL